jgi:hypothetical protein
MVFLRFSLFLAMIAAAASTLSAPADASSQRCVRMYSQGPSEFVVNSCDVCRRVSVQRRRANNQGAPTMRTYDLLPGSKFSLPFKGPGRSRVTSDIPCRDVQERSRDVKNTAKGDACVSLVGTARGGIALVNECGECRAAAVERFSITGQSMGREFYKLGSKDSIRVNPKGASRVGYLADVACPS